MGGRSRLSVIIFVFTLYENSVLGQVGSICRPNERFLSCGGCQPTCKDPVPVCAAVCKTGCYCNEGEVRNDTGHCIKLSGCPPIPSTYLHTTEPRPNTYCPENQEYRFCEPCNKTCDNPNPICPAQCARGCFCVDGLIMDVDGRCVKKEYCRKKKNESSNYLQPEYQITCGPHQTYKRCQECEKTCSYPHPVCQRPCSAGCFCEEGYFKSPSGQCVRLENCPRAEISMGEAQNPSVEDCRPDEIFLQCGWCEPSCSEPRPECPAGVCTRGCLCKPPLLRHHSGHCVEEKDCMPQKCSEHNEEYVCRYGCEAKCVSQQCYIRPRRCVLGCHCKLGLFRDVTGRCVTRNNCVNVNPLPDQEVLPWVQDVTNLNNNTFQDLLKYRDPYRKVNESVFKTYSDDNKGVFEVGTYVELNPLMTNYEYKHKNYKDSVSKNSNNDGTTPKSFKDIISMARKYYKEFADTPIYSDIPIEIRADSFRTIPIELIDDRENDFKDIEILKNEQIKDFENEEDNGRKIHETNSQYENKHNKKGEGAFFPAKELNNYVKEFYNAIKHMITPKENVTLVNI